MKAAKTFKVERPRLQRLVLPLEKINTSMYTNAGELRAFVRELDRVGAADDTTVQMRYRDDEDSLGPEGWSLTAHTERKDEA
jgi:hypothetical protein